MEIAQQQPPTPTFEQQGQEVYRVAMELFRQEPDWVTFFREILGLDGVIRRVFTTPEALVQYEKTPFYTEIQKMLAKLRKRSKLPLDDKEPTRVITVRMPKSLHESLRAEAHDRHTSINKLCITKLLQLTDTTLVPTEN